MKISDIKDKSVLDAVIRSGKLQKTPETLVGKDRYIETKDGLFDLQTNQYINAAQQKAKTGEVIVTS